MNTEPKGIYSHISPFREAKGRSFLAEREEKESRHRQVLKDGGTHF